MDSTVIATGFPFEQLPRYVLRDRDTIFGNDFPHQVRDMGPGEFLHGVLSSFCVSSVRSVELAEWLMAPVSKPGIPEKVSGWESLTLAAALIQVPRYFGV